MTLFEILPSLRHAATPRIDRAIWPLTTHLDELGRLCVGEMALTEVADEFGTPTYVIDEADFRHRIRCYRAVLPEARLAYAGRALLSTAVAQWVAEEGRDLGVCSRGELATALIAGVDPKKIVVHGMATTPGELHKAANAVGRVVVDGLTEVALLAAGLRQPQAVQVRVSPDIDCHEHSSVTADLTDQTLGVALTDGHAADAIQRSLDQPLLNLVGLHCHIGSQVTDASLYGEAIRQIGPSDGRGLCPSRDDRDRAEHRWRTRYPVCARRPGVGSRCAPGLRRRCTGRVVCGRALSPPDHRGRAGSRDQRARWNHALSGPVGAVTTRRQRHRGGGRRIERPPAPMRRGRMESGREALLHGE